MQPWRMTLAAALPAVALVAGVRADTPQELANRRVVSAFYEQAFGAKDVAAALQFLGPGYVEHDPSTADGQEGLAAHIARLKEAHPQSRHEVTQVVAEGDHVVLHVHVVDAPGSRGESMAHIYRLDGGRIVEHWGMTQPVPDTPNPDNPNSAFGLASPAGAASTATGPRDRAREARHKQIVTDFYNAALNEKNWEKAVRFIGPRYTQHSLYAPDGPGGLRDLVDRLRDQFPLNRGEIKRAFVDRDLVVLHLRVRRTPEVQGWCVFEMMQLEDDKVVEHWDTFQTVPTSSANGHPMC